MVFRQAGSRVATLAAGQEKAHTGRAPHPAGGRLQQTGLDPAAPAPTRHAGTAGPTRPRRRQQLLQQGQHHQQRRGERDEAAGAQREGGVHPGPLFLRRDVEEERDPVLHLVSEMSNLGSGDSSVVRAPDSWSKGRGFKSLLERRENFLLRGRLSVLTLTSVSVPPPCYRSST